jgi:hypothetical protein
MPYCNELPMPGSACEIAMIRDLARLLLERIAAATKEPTK